MSESFESKRLAKFHQHLLTRLPPNLPPADLPDFILKNVDWDREIPDPTERQQIVDQVQRELLGKLHTVAVAETAGLCPQCGLQATARLSQEIQSDCPVCGHPSQDMFSVASSVGLAVNELEKLPQRFELQDCVGEGSFGIVYRAWDRKLQRQVAIKMPKFQLLNRDVFLREARAASQLSHPNIVRIYDVGEIGQQTFIVSDLIKGITLGRWAATAKPDIPTACHVMLKIAQAIEHAHQAGVIHRDLKPGNILIDDRLEPVVLDFGLSHSRTSQFESIAKPGSPVGTPAFMSPEQVQGRLDRIDTWTDVYGLGVILYQLVTGTLPFSGTSEHLYIEIVEGPVCPPRERNPQVPPALNAIILKAMEKAPEGRYFTAHEFATDLRRYLEGEWVSAYRRLDARVATRYTRRYFLPVTAFGLAGGLLAVWASWRSERQAKNPTVAVRLPTEPPAAALAWTRLDLETATWETDTQSPGQGGVVLHLPPGFYRVVARAGATTFEVFRTVPDADQTPVINHLGIGRLPHRSWVATSEGYELPPIKLVSVDAVAEGMAFVPGGTFEIEHRPGRPIGVSGQKREVSPFLVDRREITQAELLSVFPEYQGPLNDSSPQPAQQIDWDMAVAYAEAVGKSLPSVWELWYVATNRGTTPFPWGDELPEFAGTSGAGGVEPAERRAWLDWLLQHDRTLGDLPVFDLVGGVAEWTVDRQEAVRLPVTSQIVLPADPHQFHLMGWDHLSEFPVEMIRGTGLPPVYLADGRRSWPGVGFRCVRRLND